MRTTQILGHRGAPRLAWENTLESFIKALELGVDVIEFDIRKTKDNVLVVFHNESFDGEKISKLSLEQLNQKTKLQNFVVPSLEETLKLLAGKVKLQIEIKEPGYELQVADMALKFLKPEDFFIISFNFSLLKRIRKNYSQINLALLIGTRYGRITQILLFALRRKKILAVVNAVSISWKLWISGFIKLLPPKIPLTVWNADETRLITALLNDESVSVIGSNVPDLAINVRNLFYAQPQ